MKNILAIGAYILLATFFWGLNNDIVNTNKNLSRHFDFYMFQKPTTDTIKPLVTDLGYPFISNFDLETRDHQFWSITQDNYGQMIFADRYGLTVFNGKSFNYIKIPSIPIFLKSLPENDLVIVGCEDQFGFIKQNSWGEYEYKRLSKPNKVYKEITEVKVSEDRIYIFSENTIFTFDKELNIVDENTLEEEGEYKGIVLHNNQLFVSKSDKGLYKIEIYKKDEFIVKSKSFSKLDILFSIPIDSVSTLIGTSGNKLFRFDGKKLKKYTIEVAEYLEESSLAGGVDIDKEKFALSTLSGGLIIIDKKSSKVSGIINYKNGLPDDEIFALALDKNGALWVSHGFGISRINYDLPVKDFNSYPGIEGELTDVIELNNINYVSTTEGVFYLDTVANLTEYNTYVRKKEKVTKSREKEDKRETKKVERKTEEFKRETIRTEKEEEAVEDESDKKKNIFQRWKEKREKRRKEKDDKKNDVVEPEVVKEVSEDDDNDNTPINTDSDIPVESKTEKVTKKKKKRTSYYERKKVRTLSLAYVFKKVPGVSGKCKQLLKYKNSILVTSNNALFVINDKEAKEVVKNTYINTISPSRDSGVFYVGTNSTLLVVKSSKKGWEVINAIEDPAFDDAVYTIAEDNDGNIWVGSDSKVYKLNSNLNLPDNNLESYDFGKEYPGRYSIRNISGKIMFLSFNQIFEFDDNLNKIEKSNELIDNKQKNIDYIVSQPNITWIKDVDRWKSISEIYQPTSKQVFLTNLFSEVINIKVDDFGNLWVIDGKNNLYKILPEEIAESYLKDFNVYIQAIYDDKGQIVKKENIQIEPEIRSLNFKINSPYYFNAEEIKYQYIIRGAMNDWSDWKESPEFDLLLSPGEYTVQVRAMNVFGSVSTSKEYKILVKAPFWKQLWFIFAVLFVALLIIGFGVYLYLKKKEQKLLRYNKILEEKVEERTLEIQEQKEQIEYKNREITDSLNYASQIQRAILPSTQIIESSLSDCFVINKPKDIVSGDFYWTNKTDDCLIVTAADCTGHGVPGAFLSLLGVTFLNEIINKTKEFEPNVILDVLRERVINSLHQEGFDKKRLDGIDLAMSVIDLKKLTLKFAGANNPMYIIRNNKLTEVKGDRMPVGMHAHKDVPFTKHSIQLIKGDQIYMFSDGFIDQFGGEFGRKFLSRNFKELLVMISGLHLQDQKVIIEQTLSEWQGKFEQLDDILIIGLKV